MNSTEHPFPSQTTRHGDMWQAAGVVQDMFAMLSVEGTSFILLLKVATSMSEYPPPFLRPRHDRKTLVDSNNLLCSSDCWAM